jgi:nucleoside-diphosphate-sugar epimerase
MRPLLIFGASKGVGLELARQERSCGRTVFALVREQSDARGIGTAGAIVLRGDALRAADIARVFEHVREECDVVSTLGGQSADGRRADDEGNVNVIAEAERTGRVSRFVLVTSIGCGEMAPFRSDRAIAAFGAAVDAKTRAEERLRTSGMPWTIIRPGGLSSEPATGRGILSDDPEIHGFIHRQDVADLVSRALRDPATIGQALAAVDAGRMTCVRAVRPFPILA